MDSLLDKVYTDIVNSTGSFTGVNNLYYETKKIDPNVSIKQIKNYLKDKNSYTLHKLTRKRFPRRRVVSPKPKIIAGSDLIDMQNLSKQNNGVRFILIVIDLFSRFASVETLKGKNADLVAEKLKIILQSVDFNGIVKLQTDEGSEYYNKTVKNLLKKRGIQLYSTQSREIKVSIAERFIRTLKSRIYKYMTHNNVLRYVDVLKQIVENYNDTKHRTLGETPRVVHNIIDIRKIRFFFKKIHKLKREVKNNISRDLDVGESVSIANIGRHNLFMKGFKVQNTKEIFKIKNINSLFSPKTYYLEDLEGEPIIGTFYREELVPTSVPKYFDIEIKRRKTINNVTNYLVHWVGYPDKYDSWINIDQIIKK